ncbi:MAG: prepilin-type N-terminal cleavage/methylation domain-containing protein [Nitrospirota bacterium]|nr:prepilin-type N-terminal cleavage/methylation domain-containing protein [Nitrospirota bacterium]
MATHDPFVSRSQIGFTLIEVMIAMTISMFMIGMVFETFIHQNKAYLVQEQVTDMQNEARAVLDLLAFEVQMARYGTPSQNLTPVAGCGACKYWFTANPELVTNPLMIQGAAGAPDQFKFARVENRTTTLAVGVAKGATQMTVAAGGGKILDTGNDIFVINNFAVGKISAGLPTDVLTVDMILFNKKTSAFSFPEAAGVEVAGVEVITYRLTGSTLERVDDDGTTVLSDNVEDFQVSGVTTTLTGNIDPIGGRPDTYRFSVTVRAPRPDKSYKHPVKGDNYRRVTLTQDVTVRNLGIEPYQFPF